MERFAITRNEALPKLAWLFRWDHRRRVGSVECGSDVVLQDDMFWEGIHCSPEHPKGTLELSYNLASGVFVADDVPHVFTQSHTSDRIFSLSQGNEILFSNSLPFLLSAGAARLLDDYLFYPWDFETLSGFDRELPLEGGRRLKIYCNCILRLEGGSHKLLPYREAPPFKTYEEYVALLNETIDGVLAANGRAPNRAYAPMSTVSRGYDSTAINVLLQRWNVKDVLSILDGRGLATDSEDTAELSAFLGLRVHAVRRRAYLEHGLEAERLFYIYGLAENIPFYPLGEHLKGRLLFTGHNGDSMWGKDTVSYENWPSTSSTFATQCTMQELRLRLGFVNFPPATIGYQHQAAAAAISNSPAMRAWSVGGDYDRPIPRRIAEEFGVPREWFGIAKSAVTVSAGLDAKDDQVSPDFAELLGKHVATINPVKFALARLVINPIASLIQGGGALFQRGSAAPVTEGGKVSQLARLKKVLKSTPLRRKLLRRITPLTFAAQVACRLATEEYDAMRTGPRR